MIFRFFQQSCLFCHFWPFWPHLPHFTHPHGPPHIPCGLNLYPHIPWAQPTYRWHCESKYSMIFRFFQQSCLFCHFWPFWPHFCTPMGYPMAFFHFFLIGCCEWSIVLLISSKKSGTFSFFFIIFSSFSPIFQKNDFLAHLAHFTPPHGPPHIPCGLNLYPHIPWAQPTYRWHCVSK